MFDETCKWCGSPSDAESERGPYYCATGHEFYRCPYCTDQSKSSAALIWCCTETD